MNKGKERMKKKKGNREEEKTKMWTKAIQESLAMARNPCGQERVLLEHVQEEQD